MFFFWCICTYDKQTPDSPQECNSELTFKVLPDEDDDTEVGIETITDEEGREHQEPGHWGWQQISLNLENQQHREDSQTERVLTSMMSICFLMSVVRHITSLSGVGAKLLFLDFSPDERYPDLKETDPEPPQQLLLSEQHYGLWVLSTGACSCSFVTEIWRPLIIPLSTFVGYSLSNQYHQVRNQLDLLPIFCQPLPSVTVDVKDYLVSAKFFPRSRCTIRVRKMEKLRI